MSISHKISYKQCIFTNTYANSYFVNEEIPKGQTRKISKEERVFTKYRRKISNKADTGTKRKFSRPNIDE